MWNFFNLKRYRYNLRDNFLSKLPDTSTSRYGTHLLFYSFELYFMLTNVDKFKKTHDVTVVNPKLDTYFFHSLHGQFFSFHSSTLSTLKVQYPRF